MKFIDELEGSAPVISWADDIEPGAMEQIQHLAALPFTFRHVAIMPDVHQGYGMPIGGVLATTDVVIPNAVGVDIGCGMCAQECVCGVPDQETLKKLLGQIRKEIPVGFGHHKEDQYLDWEPQGHVSQLQWAAARKQVGTLGGGNHFIELQQANGHLWFMIHSGSRNVGFQVAHIYNTRAKELNAAWHVDVPREWDLAFLPLDSSDGQDYLTDMRDCLQFAWENRERMRIRVAYIIACAFNCTVQHPIDVHHNYARMENHFGKNVMVHRKGATSARFDELGIIPGSQGSFSYIVKGLGNSDSFTSCSHGAGRRMGRKDAERRLDLADEVRQLDERGILHAIRGKGDLDEAPGAYKSIEKVIEQQADLVQPVTELRPLAVVKG